MTWARIAFLVPVALGALRCDGSDSAFLGTNALDISTEVPAALSLSTVDSVDYRLIASSGATLAGMLERSGVNGADSPVPLNLWRSRGLSVAEGRYVVELNVRNQLGDAVCTDSTSFHVDRGTRTEVHRPSPCQFFDTNPTGDVEVTLEAPPRVADEGTSLPRDFDVRITCSDASADYAPVGTSREPGAADFGAGPVVTDRWRAVFDSVPAERCRASIRELNVPPGAACEAEVEFAVAASDRTKISVIVPCPP